MTNTKRFLLLVCLCLLLITGCKKYVRPLSIDGSMAFVGGSYNKHIMELVYMKTMYNRRTGSIESEAKEGPLDNATQEHFDMYHEFILNWITSHTTNLVKLPSFTTYDTYTKLSEKTDLDSYYYPDYYRFPSQLSYVDNSEAAKALCRELNVDNIVYYDTQFVISKEATSLYGRSPIDAIFHKPKFAVSFRLYVINKDGQLVNERDLLVVTKARYPKFDNGVVVNEEAFELYDSLFETFTEELVTNK